MEKIFRVSEVSGIEELSIKAKGKWQYIIEKGDQFDVVNRSSISENGESGSSYFYDKSKAKKALRLICNQRKSKTSFLEKFLI